MNTINYSSTLGLSCAPALVVSPTDAVNDVSTLSIYDANGSVYCDVQYSYSLDGVCWSCYDSQDNITDITSGLSSDFFVRAKVKGTVGDVKQCGLSIPYTTLLAQGFDFTNTCTSNSSNMYSPYSNMDTAMALYQWMANTVSCMIGIPIYYFKVAPNSSSKDITFKEYCLMNVVDVKLIKLMVADGLMPSSRPDYNEFGIDFLTDWETLITKSMFATAFGTTALPQEGDIIYIPMQQRMWMVSSAYEEKKDGFMWNNVAFNVNLVKYQEKDSLDLQDLELFVASLVTKTYENLFGDDENIDGGEELTEAPLYAANNLYSVFESDAVRKYASVETIDFKEDNAYLKAMKLADNFYQLSSFEASIVYLHQYCGDSGTLSFILKPLFNSEFNNTLVQIGSIKLNISGNSDKVKLTLVNNANKSIEILNGNLYFIYMRWSRKLNVIELVACEYTYNQKIPLYKLKPFHYYFNMDEPYSLQMGKFNVEMIQESKSDVILNNAPCYITNIKLFSDYHDNLSELLQQYPTSKQLIINDTARKFVDLQGNPQN